MRFSRRSRVSTSPSRVSYPTTLSGIFPHVYPDLRCIAGYLCRHNRSDPLLEPLDLVHETYLRLADTGRDSYASRAQFFYFAVGNMKRLLADHIRSRQAKKRDGGRQRVSLDTLQWPAPENQDRKGDENTHSSPSRHLLDINS